MKKTASEISFMSLKEFKKTLESGVIEITLDRRVICRAMRTSKETESMSELDFTAFKRCDKKVLESMLEDEGALIKVVVNRYKHQVCYLKK